MALVLFVDSEVEMNKRLFYASSAKSRMILGVRALPFCIVPVN